MNKELNSGAVAQIREYKSAVQLAGVTPRIGASGSLFALFLSYAVPASSCWVRRKFGLNSLPDRRLGKAVGTLRACKSGRSQLDPAKEAMASSSEVQIVLLSALSVRSCQSDRKVYM